MYISNMISLNSAVMFSSLISSTIAYQSLLHPLTEHDADLIARLNQQLSHPELATRQLTRGHRGHKHFHSLINVEVVPLTNFRNDDKDKRDTVKVPGISNVQLLGGSTNSPAQYYLPNQVNAALPAIALDLLVGTIEDAVSTDFGAWNGSGNIEITASNVNQLKTFPEPISMSRDTGKGGYLNGSKIFLFSDTENFFNTTASQEGEWVGFVSNTAAVDWNNGPLSGQPLTLRDRPGAFANEKGTMRNFVPFTTGESYYNNAMNSLGFRYAIWPSSSLIPLTSTTAAIYAPIVFTNSNNGAFNYAGATLIGISVPPYQDGRSGPIAERLNNKIFPDTAVEWGCIGGIRSWGSQGVGGNDGWIYIMATDTYGMLLARTEVGKIADASSYEYYLGQSGTWTSDMPAPGGYQTWVNGSFSNADVFYSPKHQTFIMVWQDNYIDNKFLWSYLQTDTPLIPTYDGTDFVENIVKYSWAPTQTLYQAPAPAAGYAYSGGVHMGYFEDNDLINGGSQLLITWTAETGKDAASIYGGYTLMSAIVSWE